MSIKIPYHITFVNSIHFSYCSKSITIYQLANTANINQNLKLS